jgi:hypothetical protein
MVVPAGVSDGHTLLNWLWLAPNTHSSALNFPSETVGLARFTAWARLYVL